MGFGKDRKIYVPLILLFTFFSTATFAQTKDIEVGMWVKTASCPKASKTFRYMDLYIKSLVPDTVIPVDSASGEGVYESFFVKGSEIDGKRLPCAYSNKKFKVAALHELNIKGEPTRIMLLYGQAPNEMIWVVFDKAIEASEISW